MPNSMCGAKRPGSYLASAWALDDPQHCLYFRPELQGQGALRPGGLPVKLRAAVSLRASSPMISAGACPALSSRDIVSM